MQAVLVNSIDVLSNQFNLYPYPTSDIVTIKGLSKKKYSISIYNSVEELLFIESSKSEISLQQYPRGIYYYLIEIEEEISTGSIIKL